MKKIKYVRKQLLGLCSLITISFGINYSSSAQNDTVTVQTFNFNSAVRSGIYVFPNDTAVKFEKAIMQYSLRCKNGLISDGNDRNKGCGEWDYNCYTYLVDSARVDSFKTSRPSYDITNFSGTSFLYNSQQFNNYIQHRLISTTVTNITNPSTASVGTTTDTLPMFGGIGNTAKIQLLWTQSELTAAGLVAGNISAVWFDVAVLGEKIDYLRLKMQNTLATSVSAATPIMSGLQDVYLQHTTFANTGINKLNFHTPFNWDGTSNILLEISYLNNGATTPNMILGANNASNTTIEAKDNDAFLQFFAPGQVVDLGKNVTITGNKKRTIEGWAYAKAFNDGGIWDAGAKGTTGADFSFRTTSTTDLWRVQTWGASDFDVTLPGSKNSWHHYAMVYDGLTIKFYYDGVLKGSKPYAINTIQDNFRLGTWYGTAFNGYIDEVRIWDTVIPPATLKDWSVQKLSAAHPYYSHLHAQYSMDEGQGKVLNDATANYSAGDIQNGPLWAFHKGVDKFKSFTNSTQKPFVTFGQGNYQTTLDTTYAYDTLPKAKSRVIAYAVSGSDIVVVDTTYKTPAPGWVYTYNEAGNKIDSVYIPVEDSLIVTPLNYVKKSPSKIELINFITPYGINLNLNGLNGRTWEFDVTDYLPVLKGPKFLAIEGAPYQEDMDIRFLFIKGTPAREVKDIRQIWPNAIVVGTNFNQSSSDKTFEPRDIKLDANAESFKVRTAISGHGQEGEFTPQAHFITVNPGAHEAAWQVWKKCGTNPIYPQGGTWVYDRAGWCPGSVVDVKEVEITPWVSPGQNVTLDYGMYGPAPTSGQWDYRVNSQLVTYGPANFNTDAAIDYIKNPSTRIEFSRNNPMCTNPIDVLKNTGKSDITSADILYGLKNGVKTTYTWTGTLKFTESIDVVLPHQDWSAEQNGDFEAEVVKVNEQTDEYSQNNFNRSNFVKPPVYPAKLVVLIKSNSSPIQNKLTITDASGNKVYTKTGMSSNKLYKDTLRLGTGCYFFKITDSGGDGLSFFANAGQGTGSLQLLNGNGGAILRAFNPDFGAEVTTQFYVTDTIYNGINPEPKSVGKLDMKVYPNPVEQGQLWVRTNLPEYSKATLYIYDILGQVMTKQAIELLQNDAPIAIDIQHLKSGIYEAVLQTGNQRVVQKFNVTK